MRIFNRFEGANPRRASDVEKLAPDRFLLHPWSEDGDGNYKFCLNVEAVNDSPDPRKVTLLIDWEDLEYMDCRDYVLVGRDEKWEFFQGRIDGMITVVEAVVPPGEWFVGLHPVYDLDRCDDDCRRAVESGFDERVYGRSGEDRELVSLSVGPMDVPAAVVVCRFHPYETAGSFCVSEMLEVLSADLESGGPLTEKNRFVIVPMPNPDGVAAGCCKRSRPGGPDICHEGADSEDPAGRALAELVAEVAPRAYLDLHGWMYRNHDGLCFSRADKCDALVEKLCGEAVFSKEWKRKDWSDLPDRPGDFYSRAWRDHRATCFVISPTWFGRSVPDMREFGRKLLAAFCELI
jgi:hypothetical protein